MPHFKLVRNAPGPGHVDEIVLKRDEATGEPSLSLSIGQSIKIEEEKLLESAKQLAHRLGYTVVESEAPEEESEDAQPVGDDVRGMSPTNVGGSGAGQPGAQDQNQAPPPPQGTPSQAGSSQSSGQSGSTTTP